MVLKSNLFPNIDYLSSISKQKEIEIDVNENYQKRSYRNKYDVLTSNGKLTLSVPLKQGKNNQQNIKDVQIAYDEDWPKKHIETIKSAYGKSAYFEHYFPMYNAIIFKKPTFLFDLNQASTFLLIKSLKLDVTISESNLFHNETKIHNENAKAYPQVFEHKYGFVGGLSGLDLLFNLGPEGVVYL